MEAMERKRPPSLVHVGVQGGKPPLRTGWLGGLSLVLGSLDGRCPTELSCHGG
jgi:hypothetical protein